MIPAKRRVRRVKRRQAAVVDPPVLVAANFVPETSMVELYFDRDVSIDAFVSESVTVNDDQLTFEFFRGAGAAQPEPRVVKVWLATQGPSTGPGTTMTATPTNGIRAVANGAAWPGVTDWELPVE